MDEDILTVVRMLRDVTPNIGKGRELLGRVWRTLDHYTNGCNYDYILGKENNRRDVG